MSGYLAEYGAGEEQRERNIKRAVLWGLVAVIVAAALYFTFRDWRQEQTVKQFFALLAHKDYQQAYRMWGCTQDTPCKYYPPEQFNQDWGASSPFANVTEPKIDHVDTCGSGVVFDLEVPKSENVGLWVERGTNVLSFPGRDVPGRICSFGTS